MFDTNHVKYNKPLNENYFFSSLKWGGKRHTHTQHLECDCRTSWDSFICSWHWMETTKEQTCLKSRFATLIKQSKANHLRARQKGSSVWTETEYRINRVRRQLHENTLVTTQRHQHCILVITKPLQASLSRWRHITPTYLCIAHLTVTIHSVLKKSSSSSLDTRFSY